MNRHIKLFTPGPGDVDEIVLEAMAHPVIRHYGPEWMPIYDEMMALLRRVFQTGNDLYFVPGAASALMDMAIGSLAAAGQKIIVGKNGFFGERLAEIAGCCGLQVVPFEAPLGEPLDPDELRGLLRRHPEAQAVALVHHETGTTVLNPLRRLAAASREAGRVIIVDAVSSMGGVECPVDDWEIDVCVTTPNKCLEAVPGIGFISVSPRAWALIDSQPDGGHGWYLSLKVWRKYLRDWGTWHPSPVTLPTNIVLASLASLRRILAGGLDAQFAKYAEASRTVRTGLRNLGFEMFVREEYAAPMVTGVKARPEFPVAEMLEWLVAERGIAVGGGFGALTGKIFRVGHLGKAATREYLADVLSGIEDYLRFKGFSIPPGAGGYAR